MAKYLINQKDIKRKEKMEYKVTDTNETQR